MERHLVKDYENLFNVEDYLEQYFKDPKTEPWILEKLHPFWKTFSTKKNLTLLEYGGGPNISRLISACQYVEKIVFSDFAEVNRQAVHDWMGNKGFNWKATFDFVVQELEGQDHKAASDREDGLRSKIKAIVPCDITASNPLDTATLPEDLLPPYDVVFTSYCLDSVVESDQEYKDSVYKLANLVKPGGYLVMHGDLEGSYSKVGEYMFYSYGGLNKKLVVDSLENAGLKDIVYDFNSVINPIEIDDAVGEFFCVCKNRIIRECCI